MFPISRSIHLYCKELHASNKRKQLYVMEVQPEVRFHQVARVLEIVSASNHANYFLSFKKGIVDRKALPSATLIFFSRFRCLFRVCRLLTWSPRADKMPKRI